MDFAWTTYSHALWFYSHACQVRILGFVMMKNHFHLLLQTPQGNLSTFMKLFMKKTSDEIREQTNMKNHLYGGRYYPSLVMHDFYYRAVVKYVYQNPLRAGICRSVEDYPYSTLQSLIGKTHSLIPIHDDLGLMSAMDLSLRWLNEQISTEQSAQISQGLRVQNFKPKANSSNYFDSDLLKI
jgi:putative transposase